MSKKSTVHEEFMHDAIMEQMDIKDFWENEFPEVRFNSSGNSLPLTCPNPEHEDSNPSFHVHLNGESGCFSCGYSATSPLWYLSLPNKEKTKKKTYGKILKFYYEYYVCDLVEHSDVLKFNRTLLKAKKIQKILKKKYGITVDEIKKYLLGYDEHDEEGYGRFIVPIEGEVFAFDSYRRIKVHPEDLKIKKRKNLPAAKNHPRVFPPYALKEDVVFLCEGEPDTICLRRYDFNAVTVGGAKSMTVDKAAEFEGKIVYTVFDPDEAGKAGVAKAINHLRPYADKIYRIDMPDDLDVCDFFVTEGRSKKEFKFLVKNATAMIEVKDDEPEYIDAQFDEIVEEKDDVIEISITEIYDERFKDKRICFDAQAVGTGTKVYAGFDEAMLLCEGGDQPKCNGCPNEINNITKFSFERPHPINAAVSDKISDRGLVEIFKDMLEPDMQSKRKCNFTIHNAKRPNFKLVSLAPAVTRSAKKTSYQPVEALCAEKIETPKKYRVYGKVVVSPTNQKSILIIDKVEPISQNLDNYVLASEMRKTLKSWFKPEKQTVKGIIEMLDAHVNFFGEGISEIYGREPLVQNTLLTLFSSIELQLEKKPFYSYIRSLIIGDTNTGKNQVIEAMLNYFNRGTLITGGGASEAGLIGGIFNHIFSAGLYPQNDLGFLATDEGSQVHYLSNLKGVREGRVHYNKGGINYEGLARTRAMHITNVPRPKSLADFSFGVGAVRHLFEDVADISRFDLLTVLKDGDESYDVLNSEKPEYEGEDIPQEVWQELMTFVWSLTEHTDYIFTDEAREQTYREARSLTKKYASDIPLVQKATVRKTISKLAASIAGLMMFVNGDNKVIISTACIKVASKILQEHYDHPSCRYDLYAETGKRKNTLKNEKEVKATLFPTKGYTTKKMREVIRDLLTIQDLDVEELSSIMLHDHNKADADLVWACLNRNRCLIRLGTQNTRQRGLSRAFRNYLLKLEKEIS